MKKFNFPIIQKVLIKNFSLYRKAELVEIELNKDVFCLAGANGLGKSTFITIINYALTGIVKNPERKFTWYNDIPRFYTMSGSFAATYFDGRILEGDSELAEVTIVFTVDKYRFRITRGFFEPDEMRELVIEVDGKTNEFENLSSVEKNEAFKSQFVKIVNLSSFDQFVFLQSFVLTFDETHQLLFWDSAIMERVLHLFFGLDSEKAKKADQLRKKYNTYDSNARNLQWQITQARNELKNIQNTLSSEKKDSQEDIELYERHKLLGKDLESLEEESNRINADIKECDLTISDLSLKVSSLRSEYESIFNKSLSEDTPIERNVEVVNILNELKTRIYSGKDYSDILERLVNAIESQKKKVVSQKDKELYFGQLQEIDKKLLELNNQLVAQQKRKDKLFERDKDITLRTNTISKEIQEIETENEELLKSLSRERKEDGLSPLIKSYEEQIARYAAAKEENYGKRDKTRKEISELEVELNQSYVEAEAEFIPLFNNYAKSFLGLEINIELSTKSKDGAFLSLRMEDSARRDSFQLSESQRYFIDIALRMALIELGANTGALVIDTPEGSLDIAYESRAGKMLADFAGENYHVILTANINSSQLLLELAEICKEPRMDIERMTNWTLLSEVQEQENDRIEEAFSKIETVLNN